MSEPTHPATYPAARRYGTPPRRIVVVHGGPGAPGMVAPLARALAADGTGVLEPLQAAASVDGQVAELAASLQAEGAGPYAVVGSSWGAMLAVLTAQQHPDLVERLVLVGSAPFDAAGGRTTAETRRARMDEPLRAEVDRLEALLAGPDPRQATDAFARLADLLLTVDHLDPIVGTAEVVAHQLDVFTAVWGEVERRRAAGTLLDPTRRLHGPVLVLHGDHDPHPLDGVVGPLRAITDGLRVEVLVRCGHLPWLERDARETFLTRLRAALRPTG
jgi:pimeloyl-ACP methyl ester carboxylesterase